MHNKTYPYENQNNLPFFLTDAYSFLETSLFKQPCLLMIAQENMDITPGMIRKHLEQVEKIWDGSIIIYVQSILPSFNRKRLIEHHIPFIIPGNQMYLPHFGIDLREYFRKIHTKKKESFSPGTQATVIYALLRETDEKLTPSVLAGKLGYTLMTMTRAFDDLQAAGIGEFLREGRERYWIISNKRSLWDQAKPFLRNPINKRVWIKGFLQKSLAEAGLCALSYYSQLSPPLLSVFAVGYNQWVELKQLGLEELPLSEEASSELEIWNYNPELFAKDGIIDPFSLYLCLEASGDERIESALEEMMEKIKW